MRLLKLASLSCLLISGLAQAQENSFLSNQVNPIEKYLSDKPASKEIERLRKQEALLKAILKNSEYIQLKDGSVIDFRDLTESFQPSFDLNQIELLQDRMRSTLAVEGGTGAGG